MKTVARLLVFALAVPAFARGGQEVDFLSAFEGALQAEGLSEEEARAMAEAARSFDWSDGEDADPALIAEALVNARENGAELSAEQNAALALELAENAAEIEDEGYTRSEIAEATLRAVETLREEIRSWQEGDSDEILGEVVRDTVRDAATTAAEERPAAERGSDDDSDGEEGSVPETPADEQSPVGTGSDAGEAGKR